MRKPVYAILIVVMMALWFPQVEISHAAYSENGTIYTNTDWTSANSPYTLTGNLVIASGVTLTIQPGVTVSFESYQLQVNGAVSAQGNANGRIVFDSALTVPTVGIIFSSPAANSTISNANINGVSVAIQQGSVTFSNDYFSGISSAPLITVNNGYASISNCVLNLISTDGIDVYQGSALISENVIDGQGYNYGIYTGGSTSTTITQNNITDCFTGILADGPSSIEENIIIGNANDGVCSSNSTIEFNAIARNTCGVSGGGTVEYNTITNNSVGIWSPTVNGIITYNNIYDNYNNTGGYTQNIHLTNLSNVTATLNWWGLTDISQIGLTIWDYKNDTTHLGTVTFEPALNSRETEAPTVPAVITVPTTPPTSIQTVTATPTIILVTPVPTHQTYFTLTPSPIQSYLPRTITPGPIIGSVENSDLYSIIAIASAFIVAAGIIVAINVKFSRAKAPAPTTRRKRRRKNTRRNPQNATKQTSQG